MSSLLQFDGRITRQGVHLQFIQTEEVSPDQWEVSPWQIGTTKDTDGICMPDGSFLARIWTAVRKPRGMFGPWVVFEYNGEKHVPDLSCPISVQKLPRDARPMDNETCIATWKS